MEHEFTPKIKEILKNHFGDDSEEVFEKSHLLQYLNLKTKSASRGSKARGSFANHYAIYVIIEDYLEKEYDKKGNYSKYEGAQFSQLFKRQRELPFGSKLQNHALNHRMNQEFKKFFPTCEIVPILRNATNRRYWINNNLITIKVGTKTHNIAKSIIEIIDAYVAKKRESFDKFIEACEKFRQIEKEDPDKIHLFILELINPNVDARVFEIVSYSILKYFYNDQVIYWGYNPEELMKENLKLYKTGRTNANDGGIDFVMKPLGKFFQVTENLDVKKYFLDIDKIERYPITFVIKSDQKVEILTKQLRENAVKWYSVEAIVDKYMECIEELINIPILAERLSEAVKQGYLPKILEEIILQSKVEFNYEDEYDDDNGSEEDDDDLKDEE